jgi:hypothetical protein
MKYIVDGSDVGRYFEYLDRIGDKLPTRTREFVLHPEHYGISNDKGLHDSWVESVCLNEESTGDRHQIRMLHLVVKLLGPCHDGFHEIVYRDVQRYSLNLRRTVRSRTARIGHGDWIIDEVLLTRTGFVSHEVLFSDSGIWKIVCADIEYRWIPKPN